MMIDAISFASLCVTLYYCLFVHEWVFGVCRGRLRQNTTLFEVSPSHLKGQKKYRIAIGNICKLSG